MSPEPARDPDERRTRRLALAISLVDDVTGRPLPVRNLPRGRRGSLSRTVRSIPRRPDGPVDTLQTSNRTVSSDALAVSIDGVDVPPLVNPSGYLLYLTEDFPEGTDEVEIVVSGGTEYVDSSVPVDLGALDALEPVESIRLVPRPSYPFPPGSTLLRGHVYVDDAAGETDLSETGKPGVTLRLDELDAEAGTVERGEFVLPVPGLTEEVVTDGGVVEVDGVRPPLLVPTEEGTVPVPVEIVEGETRAYLIRYDSGGNVFYRASDAEAWTPAEE